MFERGGERLGGEAGFADDRERLGGGLDGDGGDHVGDHFHQGRVADAADADDRFAGCFQHRLRAEKSRVVAADVINELPALRGDLAAGEGRVEKPRAAFLHELRRGDRGIAPDGGAADDQVLVRQLIDEGVEHLEERAGVGDEKLDDLAGVRDFRRGGEEVWGRPRRAVPDRHMESGGAQPRRGA